MENMISRIAVARRDWITLLRMVACEIDCILSLMIFSLIRYVSIQSVPWIGTYCKVS